MTPKEARSIIRGEIIIYREAQLACKKELSQPHTPSASVAMSQAAVNAAALTTYHNALNELCGRKLAHEYHDKNTYRYDGGARKQIEEIKNKITWPEKSTIVA